MAIYIKQGANLIEMTEQRYDAERVLQQLLTDHPNLLVGDQDGDRRTRWLLVKAEMGVADDPEAAGRWSLDHLFLDEEGVPTLVEVKRSTDTRIRREVVGQMLDYAANASSYWGVERIRTALEAHRIAQGTDPDADLVAHLGPDADPEQFWENVATNLRAGRLRLVFVADVIPRELRAIVEFLNEQMQRTHVLAIEVKQYRAPNSDLITLVPRVIGQTEAANEAKGGRSARRISRAELSDALSAVAADAATAAEAILDWAAAHPGVEIRWTRAGAIAIAGQPSSMLVRLWMAGTLELRIIELRRLDPAWEEEDRTERLLERLERIEGVSFSGNRRHEPLTPLAPLADPATRNAFLAVLEEVIQPYAHTT